MAGRYDSNPFDEENVNPFSGFNATLTEPVDTPGRRGDQIKEMELKLHPDLKDHLAILCDDPKTTIVVLSGSERRVLDDNFGDYNMWLAAENGMFLRRTKGEWMTTMPEHLNMDWVNSVKSMFLSISQREHQDLIWNIVRLHLCGIISMQILNLEGFKRGICCSIFGLVPFQMLLLMLYKVADQLRCDLLVLQRVQQLIVS